MKSPRNLSTTDSNGPRKPKMPLMDAASQVGYARGSASTSYSAAAHPTGAGKGNKLVSANASLRRSQMKKAGRGR